MAFDTRFAVVLVGSSGEGGAKPHRRNFGEAVENLTGSGEYHWMAGNFLKYGASEASFGSKNAGDLPVDSNELIALCAPRLTFISYGVPEKGDAKWLDQQGSFMATVAAGPVFRLLGAKDLGVTEDYRTAKMPPVNTGLLDGQLAWRQHDGGHTDAPNWKYFIPWADKFLELSRGAPGNFRPTSRSSAPTRTPWSRIPSYSRRRSRAGSMSTSKATPSRGGGARPTTPICWPIGSRISSAGTRPISDGAPIRRRTSSGVWRMASWTASIRRSSFCSPAPITLSGPGGTEATAEDITRGLQAIVRVIQTKAPAATIIVTGIFPRNDNMASMPVIDRINGNLAKLADGRKVRYLNINDKLAGGDGRLLDGMMNATTSSIRALKAYQVWADALKPIFTELLGPPAAADHAPPPTGDPSAVR